MSSNTAFLKIAGVNTDSEGTEGEHTWFLKNLIPTANGFRSRTHFTITNSLTDSGAPQGIYCWKKNYGQFVTYYATDTDIHEVGVGSRVTGLTAPDYGVRFAPYGPTLFATNGVDPIQLCTGTTFTAITIPTNAGPNSNETCADIRPKFLIPFKNQLIAANITIPSAGGGRPGPGTAGLAAGTYKHLVWWSSPDNAQAFGSTLGTPSISNTDFLPIFDESIEITGLAPGEDGFFVFKEHGIYRFDGPPFNGYQPVTANIGCVAPRSIARLGEDIYFISQYGLTSINTRTSELKFHSAGKTRWTWGRNEAVYVYDDPSTPMDENGDILHLTMAGGRATVTIAADSENGLLFISYYAEGDTDYPLIWVYNVELEEFSTMDLNIGGELLGTNIHLGAEPLTTTNGEPGVKILFGAKTTSTNHTLYRMIPMNVGRGMNAADPVYARWPYLFSFPDKRVAIRRIRPVFNNGLEGFTGQAPYSITAQIYSVVQHSGVPRGTLTESSDLGNDLSVSIPNCPFADRHSVGVKIKLEDGSDGEYLISNFLGLEVEYEEDLLKAS